MCTAGSVPGLRRDTHWVRTRAVHIQYAPSGCGTGCGCRAPKCTAEKCQTGWTPTGDGRRQCSSDVHRGKCDLLWVLSDMVHIGCAPSELCHAWVGTPTGGGRGRRRAHRMRTARSSRTLTGCERRQFAYEVHRPSRDWLRVPVNEVHIGYARTDQQGTHPLGAYAGSANRVRAALGFETCDVVHVGCARRDQRVGHPLGADVGSAHPKCTIRRIFVNRACDWNLCMVNWNRSPIDSGRVHIVDSHSECQAVSTRRIYKKSRRVPSIQWSERVLRSQSIRRRRPALRVAGSARQLARKRVRTST